MTAQVIPHPALLAARIEDAEGWVAWLEERYASLRDGTAMVPASPDEPTEAECARSLDTARGELEALHQQAREAATVRQGGELRMTLKTRKPTGAVPWPLILVEGGEKTGKSWAAAVLSASAKVGRMFWIDLGEGSGDEYGAIPGTDYEIVEYDGTFRELLAAVREIHEIAAKALADGRPPVALVIDSMTAEWEGLKDWATDRARSSRSNRKKLEADPNAEIKVSTNYWNDAHGRHRALMRLLMTFPGIAVMVARGKETALIGTDGQPVEGQKDYRVEGQRDLGADASCWVRLRRDSKPLIVGARSVHHGIRPGIDPAKTMPDDWSLEWLVFDALKCDPATSHARKMTDPKAEAVTPEQIRDEACNPQTPFGRIRELYHQARELGYDEVTVIGDTGDDESLLSLLTRLGNERGGGHAGGNGHGPATRSASGQQAASGDDARPARQAPVGGNSRAQQAPEDDPVLIEWAARVDEITDMAGAMTVREELATTNLDPQRLRAIGGAIDAKLLTLQRPRPARNRGPAAEERGAQAVPVGKGDDGEWVQGWMQRLADATTDEALGDLQRQIGPAVAAKKISPAKSADLSKAVKDRRSELEQVPA